MACLTRPRVGGDRTVTTAARVTVHTAYPSILPTYASSLPKKEFGVLANIPNF